MNFILSYIFYILLIMITNITSQDETKMCRCERQTISVQPNQLIDTCTLGEEFKISLKIYMNKHSKAKHILTVVDENGKRLLLIRNHNRRQKIVIESSLKGLKLKGVTDTANLKSWDNNVEIEQKRRLQKDLEHGKVLMKSKFYEHI